ncbi:MAG: FliM/FliN family flagellar motor switch protein [Candidatus Contendobacter sp.]|jgi:flagellar motor switch protein FliM|nr:FliM/FliN family flagellar motor switch protein [Gammaproteobacteria bacterium]MCC8992835.1 FliM/FliN family flagellar motor switch protein [Candidatus Contendobacter sp.]
MSTDEFLARDELLTQDERDALSEVISQKLGDGPAIGLFEHGAVPYDLANHDYTINSLLPALVTIHERFTHRLRIGLFELLRRDLTVAAGPIEKRSHTDLTASLQVPCSVNVIGLPPLSGPVLLIFDQELIFMVVDTFFGGTGRRYSSTNIRDFTATENRFIQRLLELSFRCLQEAWEPFAALQCVQVSSENKPQFITEFNPTELLAVSSVQVSRDTLAGSLYLALPYSSLEPIRKNLLDNACQEQRGNPDAQLTGRLFEGIQESPVDAHCFLAGFELTLSDLLSLKVGDVIPVNIPAKAVLRIEDVPIYSGVYGVAQGWRALKIEQALNLPGEWAATSVSPQDFSPFEAKT